MAHQQSLHHETKDELLTVLADHNRRAILSYFRESSEQAASVNGLAKQINGEGHSGEKPLAIKLRHSALPRLADVGVIEYDRKNGTVQYQGHSELEELLECIADI